MAERVLLEQRIVTQDQIDQRVFDLYDEYCHGRIDRRTFLARATVVAVGGLAMAQSLLPQYARAQTVSFTDSRIKARYVTYPSPGGSSGQMRGYLVQPAGNGPFPGVLVIHENRGLNPYIEDVARRAAVAGFLALAPDGLFPVGGYPGNDDDGRALQAKLDAVVSSRRGPQSGIFCDGSANPNPGPGGWGVVAVRDGAILWSERGDAPHTTNNRMELSAIIAALRRLPCADSPTNQPSTAPDAGMAVGSPFFLSSGGRWAVTS